MCTFGHRVEGTSRRRAGNCGMSRSKGKNKLPNGQISKWPNCAVDVQVYRGVMALRGRHNLCRGTSCTKCGCDVGLQLRVRGADWLLAVEASGDLHDAESADGADGGDVQRDSV